MITEDYVSYEVAKLLKEKGFDWPCHGSYHIEYPKNKIVWTPKPVNDDGQIFMNAPTHQMAMKWLREVYDIHISVDKSFIPNDIDDKPYHVYVGTEKCHTSYNAWSEYHSTYEEAVEAALKYCLTELI